jgi:hypothetical protein
MADLPTIRSTADEIHSLRLTIARIGGQLDLYNCNATRGLFDGDYDPVGDSLNLDRGWSDLGARIIEAIEERRASEIQALVALNKRAIPALVEATRNTELLNESGE